MYIYTSLCVSLCLEAHDRLMSLEMCFSLCLEKQDLSLCLQAHDIQGIHTGNLTAKIHYISSATLVSFIVSFIWLFCKRDLFFLGSLLVVATS